jgi:hypothetical protein
MEHDMDIADDCLDRWGPKMKDAASGPVVSSDFALYRKSYQD